MYICIYIYVYMYIYIYVYIYIYTCIHTYIIHRILAQVSDDSLDALDAERDSSRSPARSVVGLVLYRVALLAKLWISKYQIVSSCLYPSDARHILLLVGGLEHFYFSISWECHHPN